jgi:hypothetical protein
MGLNLLKCLPALDLFKSLSTMPNRSADPLFLLIHSLRKAEKRNFKLYIKRNSSNEDLKVIQLFDALDKMSDYDEVTLLKKNSNLKKQQLYNLKSHLYKQLLSSLRLLENNDNIDIQLHEQLDFARILYNKGLYVQSLRILDKAKETARIHNQVSFLMQILFLEKKIESMHITRSLEDRADQLTRESLEVNERIELVTILSNLALQLYSWYIKNGHARNEDEERKLKIFFEQNLPKNLSAVKTFYQRLYLYQSFCWFSFIRQDFLMYYRYTKKWVDLFEEQPMMIEIESSAYIKGVHNLLNALFGLNHYVKFEKTLKNFENFAASPIVEKTDNNKLQVFIYLNVAKINKHFMTGTFEEGLYLVPAIEERIKEYSLQLDSHRVLVFYYKIASLYFGSGDYDNCIIYLNKIINWKLDLRNDLQCYARLLHLIAHYELGNFQLLEYLVKSVYRFMAKMENLSVVEEEMFKFIRKSFNLNRSQLHEEFKQLLERIKDLRGNRFEARAFSYLDILSWLESKVYRIPLQAVIRKKYKTNLHKKINREFT